MPTLDDPRHERFAIALALGESPKTAAIRAGYDERPARSRRRAARADIAARVAALGDTALWGGDEKLAAIFATLLKLANQAGEKGGAPAWGAASRLLVAAARLRIEARAALPIDPASPPTRPLRPAMSHQEWIATYAHET